MVIYAIIQDLKNKKYYKKQRNGDKIIWERGFCYTAMEFPGGGELLLAYCCGRLLDGLNELQDLKIRKLNLNELWKD